MDYKAKYEEALEDMRVIYHNLKGDAKLAVEHAFPELHESGREDERMIKRIKQAITGYHPNRTTEEDSRMLAYLDEVLAEKKQKPVACQGCAEHIKGYISGRGDAENKLLENFGAIVTPENNELRIQARSKPAEWSEEDKKHRQWILECLADGKRKVPEFAEQYQAAFDWLKSLPLNFKKEDVAKLCSNEWSEEDEKCLQELMQHIEHCVTVYGASQPEWQQWLNLLKSIRPQPHWKPSEEQMNSLNFGIHALEEEGYDETAREIKELYEQLKKLMED